MDKKSAQFKIQLPLGEKEAIAKFADDHGLTMTVVCRAALSRFLISGNVDTGDELHPLDRIQAVLDGCNWASDPYDLIEAKTAIGLILDTFSINGETKSASISRAVSCGVEKAYSLTEEIRKLREIESAMRSRNPLDTHSAQIKAQSFVS